MVRAEGNPFFAGGGFGVGVFVRYFGVHFFSIEERMATGSAPDLYISIASRATSIHDQTCRRAAGELRMAFLELVGIPDGTPRELGPETSIGSGAQVAWHVAGKDLAARHFTVHANGEGAAKVVPASAQHIVFVNGEPVPVHGAAIKGGDVISAGSAHFIYLKKESDKRPEVPAPTGPAGPPPTIRTRPRFVMTMSLRMDGKPNSPTDITSALIRRITMPTEPRC